MKKNNKKEILLCIISFFAGAIFIYLIQCNNKEVVETKNLEETMKAVYVIETYNGTNKESEGTGFIYKTDSKYAYLLTNEHVIVGENIKIKDENKEIEGNLVGKDEYLDLAIVKINKKYAKNKLSLSTKKVTIGEEVYIIGNPLGKKYSNSVTKGIISGKNRLVKAELKDKNILMEMLQTDAAINHGSSGSPLLNKDHEVIGIITLKLIDTEIEGMGFAIGIDRVEKYLDKLEKNIEIEWPELGIEVVNTSNSAQLNNHDITIPSNIKEGVVIININEKSNVKDKLIKGDIITEINENKITDNETLRYEVSKYEIDETINIKYLRNNSKKQTNIKLNSLK